MVKYAGLYSYILESMLLDLGMRKFAGKRIPPATFICRQNDTPCWKFTFHSVVFCFFYHDNVSEKI